MGHYEVKTAISTRLEDTVAGWLPEGFAAPTVMIADTLPNDETKWPCVLVQTTRASGKTATGAPREYMRTYQCQVTVAARDVTGERGEAALAATEDRDTLLEAVRNALLWAPQLDTDIRVLIGDDMPEETAPTPEDTKGRAITIGNIRFNVQSVETVPPPADTEPDPDIETADVDVAAYDAAEPPLEPEPAPE